MTVIQIECPTRERLFTVSLTKREMSATIAAATVAIDTITAFNELDNESFRQASAMLAALRSAIRAMPVVGRYEGLNPSPRNRY